MPPPGTEASGEHPSRRAAGAFPAGSFERRMSCQTGRDAIIPDISSCLPIFRPPQLHQNRENTAPLPNARPGTQEGQTVKPKQWKTVAVSLLTVLLLLALVFLVFRGHAREILQNLRAVPVVWLPVLFGLPLLYQALEAAVCRALLRERLPDFSFRQAAEVIFLGVFGNVSTFAAGELTPYLLSGYGICAAIIAALVLVCGWKAILTASLKGISLLPSSRNRNGSCSPGRQADMLDAPKRCFPKLFGHPCGNIQISSVFLPLSIAYGQKSPYTPIISKAFPILLK